MVFIWRTRYSHHIYIKIKSYFRLSKNNQISNSIKFRPVEAKLFHSDGLTGRTKLIAPFRSFAKALKTGPNQMMTIRPQTQSQFSGCSADSVLEFYWVGDRVSPDRDTDHT